MDHEEIYMDLAKAGFAPVTAEQEKAIQDYHTYHPVTDNQQIAYQAIRDATMHLSRVILMVCPKSPDRSTALRKCGEVRKDANGSIATGGFGPQ